MMDRLRVHVLATAAALLCTPGCIFDFEDEPDQTDGDVCSSDDECSSGLCTTSSLCSHTSCRCSGDSCPPEGEATDACRDGWVCVDAKSIFDPVVEFFGGEPNERRGYCMPRCEDGCPEHYACSGEHCSPEYDWAYPIPRVAWSGAVSGEFRGRGVMTTVVVEKGSIITLEGSAESPTGTEITSMTWTTVADSGERVELEGPSIELTVPVDAYYRRAELTVVDALSRSGTVTVAFEGCFGAGTSCGYQGSGCCTSCDDETSTCL